MCIRDRYYVENGVLNWDYTGLALLGSDEWYYAENGAVKNDYTAVSYTHLRSA